MDIVVFPHTEIPIALAGLKAIALADGALSTPEQQLLQALAALYRVPLELDRLEAMAPRDIAGAIVDEHRRKRLVQLAVVTALADGDIAPREERALATLARALGVKERALDVVHDVARDHRLLARIDMSRRLMGRFAGPAYEQEGLAGLRSLVAPFLGTEDLDVAYRYRELGLLPEGSLGRVYWEHCVRRRFAFPGEKGGILERLMFHDVGHVLAGYDTDAEGEIQQGAFQAGFLREDGFAFLLFVIVQFHLGLRLTPAAEAQKGLFDVPKVLRALERGAACRADLSRWSFFEHAHRPLAEVRAELGIPPL
jgi:uncharacterized tellurite resistance protein B-like protein